MIAPFLLCTGLETMSFFESVRSFTRDKNVRTMLDLVQMVSFVSHQLTVRRCGVRLLSCSRAHDRQLTAVVSRSVSAGRVGPCLPPARRVRRNRTVLLGQARGADGT